MLNEDTGEYFTVKVDSWPDGVTDPTAPEAQYAAVEAYLAAQGINAKVEDHVIKAGSYGNGKNGGGGIFRSDGTLVDEASIYETDSEGNYRNWFADAWGGKSFNDADFNVDFDQLPEADNQGNSDPQAKRLDVDNVDGDETSGDLPDGADSEAHSGDGSDTDVNAEPDEDNGDSSLVDPGVDSIDLLYPDESELDASVSDDTSVETQVNFDFDDSDSDTSGELVDAIEARDLISEEDDLQELLSDGNAPEPDAAADGSQFDSISLEENFKLDLDDGDSGESFD